ncbi:MAG: monovalent cation/H+ antiporter subunit D family protein [Candidatus Thiodiazotropha sp.]
MELSAHLPALIVIIPLLAAPLCVLFDHPRAAWFISLLSAMFCFFAAIGMMQMLLNVDALSYPMGGWLAPLGIELRIDTLGLLLLLILSASASVILFFALHSVEHEIDRRQQPMFYAALMLVLAGLIGITVTGDAFNIFVFLEISSLATYALISMGRDRRALNASFQYLIMGTIGATFILIGIGFMYVMTGTLNIQDLAQRLPEVSDTKAIKAAFAFVTVGLGLKAAMFPLHWWLPNAYAHSPSVVSAFLAATATKVAVYVLIRFLLSLYGVQYSLGALPFDKLLMFLGAVGVLAGSLVAVFQNNIKRILAYSSIAQIGYILLAIGLASQPGITAALLHLFNHALIKGTLFLALGAVSFSMASVRLTELSGFGKAMPLTMAAFVIGGLSLIGVPGTTGFISKWYLVTALLEASLWPLALLVLAASVLALVYIGRVIEVAYYRPLAPERQHKQVPLTMHAGLWVLALSNLYFGFNTELSVGLSSLAVNQLIGFAP